MSTDCTCTHEPVSEEEYTRVSSPTCPVHGSTDLQDKIAGIVERVAVYRVACEINEQKPEKLDYYVKEIEQLVTEAKIDSYLGGYNQALSDYVASGEVSRLTRGQSELVVKTERKSQ